jgi:hypothetical protein
MQSILEYVCLAAGITTETVSVYTGTGSVEASGIEDILKELYILIILYIFGIVIL